MTERTFPVELCDFFLMYNTCNFSMLYDACTHTLYIAQKTAQKQLNTTLSTENTYFLSKCLNTFEGI